MTDRPENVRMAGPADEDALYDLLLALDLDNGFGVPFSPEKVRAAIRKGTRHEGSIIGVIDGSDELAASINLSLSQPWFSDQFYLAEVWIFTRPDYRQNRLERDLFAFAKWARDEMISRNGGENIEVITSVSSPRRLPAKLRLWSRYGEQIGGIYRLS